MKSYKKLFKEIDRDRFTDVLPKYNVYYMDNDRQKVYVKKNLFYYDTINFVQKNYKKYGTDLMYEVGE